MHPAVIAGLLIVAAFLVFAGVALIYPPAALILAGLGLAGLAVFVLDVKRPERT